MQQKFALVAVFFALAALHANGLEFDKEKQKPMAKVITLLKDMAKQLEKEGEEDEKAYDKMACWCETNDREKTKAIDDAESKIETLNTHIESGIAASARLTTEIKGAEGDLAENQEAVDKATAMRAKGLAEFNAEEKEAIQAISALRSAITVLKKHHSAASASAFLQKESSLNEAETSEEAQYALKLKEAEETVGKVLKQNAKNLNGMLLPHQKKVLNAFVQGGVKGMKKAAASAPASGEIFGIMNQMLESFEANLAKSRKEEGDSQGAFEDLKAAKEEEIAAGKDLIDKKGQELASTDEKLATNKEDLEDTTKSLDADREFLGNLKTTCASLDDEWELRQKARQEEIAAVAKALAILTSDDAHDLFSKTLGLTQDQKKNADITADAWDPGLTGIAFAQKASTTRRMQAVKVLMEAAKKYNNQQLAALATRARLDAFTKVKKAIDDMVAELIQQKKDEIKHRDWCIQEIDTNERATDNQSRDRDDLNAKLEDLNSTLDELSKSIATLKDEVKELQVQLKRAGEDRQMEHAEFKTTVADQRATQKLIQSAIDVLAPVYDKKKAGVALNQQTPPAQFKEYKKQGGGGVMGMMKQIIDDAKAMEKEAIHDEEDAQKAYEDFTMDTNKSIEEKNLAIVNHTETKAKTEEDKVQTTKELESTMADLEQLANESADLHQACDFILKNFEIRQKARDEEVEALKTAKNILSGMK